MQNPMSQVNQAVRRGGWKAALGALAILATTAGTALAEPGASGPEVIPAVVPTHPYGLTYAEWLAKWWQWSLSFPVSADPENATASFSANQFGPVWFMPAPLGGGTVTRTGSVPEGVALFLPILTFEADNTGCPTYSDLTAAQLTAEAEGGWSAVAETSCTIDGVAVPGLENPTNSDFVVITPPFAYKLASHDNVVANYPGFEEETCIPDGTTVYPTVAEGACVMIAPLSVGKHTIHIVAAVPAYSVSYDVTFDLTVTPAPRFP